MSFYLYRGGIFHIPVFYYSRESVESVRRNNGLTIIYDEQEYLIPVIPFHYKDYCCKCEYIINAVKAYSVPNTIELMKRLDTGNSIIIMMQNGFGSLELAEEIFGLERTGCGIVFIGAERIERYKVKHNGGNTLFLGFRHWFNEKLFHLTNILIKGGADARFITNIEFYRWIKLAVNAVINPLTAITRERNKIILTEQAKVLTNEILKELVEVAGKHGYKLDREKIMKIVIRSAMNTKNNYSSMLQDLLNKRKTEIDYINGFISRILGRKGINWVLTQLIHLIESTYSLDY
ncbi:MAG: 2-dehydropantoate 2-reductase [Staphylothermus sp.]|nr:2-dehydropantoate 2-reductase [Staphylothermus sp.]